jgi:outer membrane protein TolC
VSAAACNSHRSEYLTTRAIDSVTGAPSLANPSISSDKNHRVADLGMSWSLLDFGLSYYTAKQNADRVLIAAERRRKAMHLLIQDVRTAFWRTAGAQKLRGDVRKSIALAEEALADAGKAEGERIRSPLDSLRYQRQLLENVRLLEAIDHDLSTARVELAHLINAPLSLDLVVAEADEKVSRQLLDMPVEAMESTAIVRNGDLREV